MLKKLFIILTLFLFSFSTNIKSKERSIMIMKLKSGEVKIELFDEIAPNHVKRIEANRKNAKLSTGPKTSAGKFRSCRNALKHGLDSRKHLIIGEDVKEFQEMKESLKIEIPNG